MPTISKRIPQKKVNKAQLTVEQIDCLCYGDSFFEGNIFTSDEEKKEVWQRNRSYLMSLIGHKKSLPSCCIWAKIRGLNWGERPHSWWLFDAPGTRKKLSGNCVTEKGNWFGRPHKFAGCKDGQLPQYESQFAFLKRNDLLLPGEEEKVRKKRSKGA